MEPLDKPKAQTTPTETPVSWQEQFVQKHNSGNPKDPVYDRFWTGVGSEVDNLLKTGKNGSITKTALAQAITKGQYQGDQALVAGALYDTFDQVSQTGALKKMVGDAQVTTKDIATEIRKLKQGEQQFHAVDDLTYWADNKKNLQRFSTDGSGAVTYADITGALNRKDLSADDRSNLQQLESKFHMIAPDGKLGKNEIDAYYNNFTANDANYKLGKQFLHDMRFISDSQNDPNSHKLFADSANPLNSIKVDGVTQGFAADCAFKASLAALVAVRPASILNMVRQNGPKDVQVDFPGMKGKAIHISPPTDEEVGLYSQQAKSGNWASALEKAYGEKVYDAANPLKKYEMSDKLPADKAATDGLAVNALETVTGHQVVVNDLDNMSDNQIKLQLEAAQKEKRAVVLNTAPGDESTVSRDGYTIDHAFTVLGINAQGVVTVRDPRDNGLNKPDGTTQISLATLKSNFKMMLVETNQPT